MDDNSTKKDDKQKKEYIDFLSRFICTVYKPLYLILLPVIFSAMMELFTTVDFGLPTIAIYWIILAILIIVILFEYFLCRYKRLKNNCLDEKQVTVIEKLKVIGILILVTVVIEIVVPTLHVMIVAHNFID